MTKTELIARQAKKIEELRDRVVDYENRIDRARKHIICIGGPMNDNKLFYSKAQLVTFARILGELE